MGTEWDETDCDLCDKQGSDDCPYPYSGCLLGCSSFERRSSNDTKQIQVRHEQINDCARNWPSGPPGGGFSRHGFDHIEYPYLR